MSNGKPRRGLVALAAAAAVLAGLLAGPRPAAAITYAFQQFTCPLDGRVFRQGLPTPGHPRGAMLDLKPWGPVSAPAVLPVCPGSRFVLYKREFGADELARLRTLVASPAWGAIRDSETDYFRVARLRGWMGDAPADVAFAYLYATWEVDDQPARYARYAAQALVAVDAALAAPPPPGGADDAWAQRQATLALVGVELDRRTGHFDDARRRLDHLADDPAQRTGAFPALRRQQRALVDASDSAPHRIALDGGHAAP